MKFIDENDAKFYMKTNQQQQNVIFVFSKFANDSVIHQMTRYFKRNFSVYSRDKLVQKYHILTLHRIRDFTSQDLLKILKCVKKSFQSGCESNKFSPIPLLSTGIWCIQTHFFRKFCFG